MGDDSTFGFSNLFPQNICILWKRYNFSCSSSNQYNVSYIRDLMWTTDIAWLKSKCYKHLWESEIITYSLCNIWCNGGGKCTGHQTDERPVETNMSLRTKSWRMQLVLPNRFLFWKWLKLEAILITNLMWQEKLNRIILCCFIVFVGAGETAKNLYSNPKSIVFAGDIMSRKSCHKR